MPHATRTEIMSKKFPIWTQIYHDPESQGFKFLDVMGHTVDEVNAYLEQESNNLHLQLMDSSIVDNCYAGDLPDRLHHHWSVKLYADYREVTLVTTPKEFYTSDDLVAYIDWSAHLVFFRNHHEKVSLLATHGDDSLNHTLSLRFHHVWNNFDEIGLLFNMPRLPMEGNDSYRERLFYTFRYPGNATRLGLLYGIAKETGLIKKVIWENPLEELRLPKSVIRESIRVDGSPYYEITLVDNEYVLAPLIEETEEPVVLSFIQGIQAYSLHEKDRPGVLHNLLYHENGTAKDELRRIAEYINQTSPILWGYFKYDEMEWDTIDPKYSGLDYVPNQFDAPVDKWEEYDIERS